MKTVKKAIAMLLAVLMVGALSCTAWADQADEVTFDNLESFREDSNVTIDMEMSILGESQVMQMKMKTASDVTLDPECSFTDMSAESDGETQHSLVYSVKEDSKYVIYTSNDEGATWEKQELGLPKLAPGRRWNLLVDTALEDSFIEGEAIVDDQHVVEVEPRSIRILCTVTSNKPVKRRKKKTAAKVKKQEPEKGEAVDTKKMTAGPAAAAEPNAQTPAASEKEPAASEKEPAASEKETAASEKETAAVDAAEAHTALKSEEIAQT